MFKKKLMQSRHEIIPIKKEINCNNKNNYIYISLNFIYLFLLNYYKIIIMKLKFQKKIIFSL